MSLGGMKQSQQSHTISIPNQSCDLQATKPLSPFLEYRDMRDILNLSAYKLSKKLIFFYILILRFCTFVFTEQQINTFSQLLTPL
jgi:hypothetical protein